MSSLASSVSRQTASSSPAPSNMIKVMIVDDSAVVRGLVTRWVGEEPGMEIVARHANGQKAVADVASSKPDIIVLDVEMPVMDGLEALPQLIKNKPGVKVIMASTLTMRNAEISMKALSLGATDYIPKPESNSGVTTSESFRRDLLQKIQLIGGSRLRTGVKPTNTGSRTPAPRASTGSLASRGAQNRGGLAKSRTQPGLAPAAPVAGAAGSSGAFQLRPFSSIPPKVLLIGSSTGGPQALVKLFEILGPKLSRIPVLVTQHMPATFTSILAKHIGEAACRDSREAVNNEPLKAGTIYVAPGNYHMRLKGTSASPVITLDQGPEVNFCRPAVDPMFESAVAIYRSSILATILTGMGHDGSAGGRIIADAGGSVIAQDEESSVVWGMPGSAATAGICSAVLPLDQIAPKLITLLK